MIIDCIADLHGNYPKLAGGDILIIAGDLTARDTEENWNDFEIWICDQRYNEKIIIPGNHDNFLSSMPEHTMWKYWEQLGITYLCDSGTEIVIDYPKLKQFDKDNPENNIYKRNVLKIWGTPWTRTFEGMNPDCMAFTCQTEDELFEKFLLIPHDTDILITHSPPYTILDGIPYNDFRSQHVGSHALFNWLKYVERPRLHVFGHIHEGYGQTEYFPSYNDKMMISVNASHVDARYRPVNKPIRVIL